MLPHRTYAQTVTGPFVYALAMPEQVVSVRNGKMGVSVPRQEGDSIYFLPFCVYPGKIG